jgi:lysophospholipid acyltransferase (LPLAT)-like uncharacterized protein
MSAPPLKTQRREAPRQVLREALLPPLLSALIRLWLKTLRLERSGDPLEPTAGGVVAFLHGEQLPLLLHRPHGDLIAPISLSRDGALQARVMASFGVRAARGSSSRGALRALLTLQRAAEAGAVALVAVDGPRGPYGVVQEGAAYVSLSTGAPLWACRLVRARGVRLRSWDRFCLPFPFTAVRVETRLLRPASPPRSPRDPLFRGAVEALCVELRGFLLGG